MRVNKLHLKNFTKHKDTVVEFPKLGIVLVTGLNGSGKSSLLEGVSYGGWGETLRGTHPLKSGSVGSAHVEAEGVWVKRSRGGSKTSKVDLAWQAGTDKPVAFETTTKAQEALEQVIGTFNVWRRTCVFSSQDTAHFTLATDAERKRLLESILNSSQFDPALERCRTDRKAAESHWATQRNDLLMLQAKLESERSRVSDAEATVSSLPPPVDLVEARAQVKQLTASQQAVISDIDALTAQHRAADREQAVLASGWQISARRLAQLDKDACDSCGQPIPSSLVASLRDAAETDKAKAEAAREHAVQLRSDAQSQLEELNAERDTFARKLFTLQSMISSETGNSQRRRQAETQLINAREAVSSLEARLITCEQQVVEASAELGLLNAVEEVLGMKGVRAHVLGRALAGLEAVANSWLARVAGPDLTLSLKSYVEKKSGGVTDAISFEVHGAGDGHGYRATSGGERRRIDVAMLLALSEVAQAAHQRDTGSTLFVDEAFDGLDVNGKQAVGECLKQLAEERCVVVITHDQWPAGALNPVLQLRVTEGVVTSS